MDVYVDLEETDEKQKERNQRDGHWGNEHFHGGNTCKDLSGLLASSESPDVRQQSRPEGQNCERDAEAITTGKKCMKWPKISRNALWEGRKPENPMSLFEEPRRSAKERDEKFQGRCFFWQSRQSGTQRVLSCAWRKKQNRRSSKNCTWEGSTVVVASISKY